MQIQQTPQHSSIELRAGGERTASQWAREGTSELGMRRGEELNRRHSLLLVLDVQRHPSLDEDNFEQIVNEYLVQRTEKLGDGPQCCGSTENTVVSESEAIGSEVREVRIRPTYHQSAPLSATG
jgi:hypothetical protein